MKSIKMLALGTLCVLGVVTGPLRSSAQVSFNLLANTPGNPLVINVVTGAAGFVDVNNAAAGNIAGTYLVIRVAANNAAGNAATNITAGNFVGSNSYTGSGTAVYGVQKTPLYTYIIIGNTDAINSPGTTFTANTTKPIITFRLTGGVGTGSVEIAALNDPIAVALVSSSIAPTTKSADILTPGETIVSVSTTPVTGVPLPVNLLTFGAIKAGTSRSLISWVTASEEAASYFEVERSVTGGENSFRSIGVRTPATNGKTEVSYQAYDETPSIGANYYRLKMVDISGKVAYSDTRIVRFDNRGATESVSLFPNPIRFEGQDVKLKVNVISAQTLTYSLVNVAGQLIYEGKMAVTAGTGNYGVTGFENIAPGSYFLRVKGETLSDNIKVLKMD